MERHVLAVKREAQNFRTIGMIDDFEVEVGPRPKIHFLINGRWYRMPFCMRQTSTPTAKAIRQSILKMITNVSQQRSAA